MLFEPEPVTTNREPILAPFSPTRVPSYEAPPPRRSFSPTSRPTPVEVTTTNELNEAEKIKNMLKSGAVGNDPRKIKEMMLKLKQAKTSAAAAAPVSNIQIQKETTTVPAPVVQTLKTWSPSKPFSYNANR